MLLQGMKMASDVPTAALAVRKRSQAWSCCCSFQRWKVRKASDKIMLTLPVLEPRGPNVVPAGMRMEARMKVLSHWKSRADTGVPVQ